jgi:hypothetical protein
MSRRSGRSLESLRTPILPQRVRRIASDNFAFLPHRFLRDGFLGALTRDELALYVFLVLAGSREGVSFYGYDAVCTLLGFHLDDYIAARNGLLDLDLLAFDGTRFQVLSLPASSPARPPTPVLRTTADLEDHDPATIRAIAQADLTSRSKK